MMPNRLCLLLATLALPAILFAEQRVKRGIPLLTFPRTSPTRVQMITGIGIPVALNFESVTIGWVFKAEYFLPENASNVLGLLTDPFDPTPQPISGTGRRKRRRRRRSDEEALGTRGFDSLRQQRFERYEQVAVEVASAGTEEAADDEYSDEEWQDKEEREEEETSNDLAVDDNAQYTLNDVKMREPNNLSTARFTLYRGMENLVEKRGLPGRPCLLRSICEAANARFDYHNGILGELAHIIMSPSTSPDTHVEHADGEYLRAEQLGRNGEPCDQVFRECPVSVLDKFSGMYNTMGGLMNMLSG